MKNVALTLRESGETAHLEIRGAAVGEGYFPTPDPDTLAEGRFVPADLVRRTSDGFFLAGRVSDVINIAGRKLHPAEIEALLAKFPGVKQAVVFGIPSARRGEEPVACVAAEAHVTRDALLTFCRENLSAWQMPRDLWMVDAIPVNERGKINRRELAARFAAEKKG